MTTHGMTAAELEVQRSALTRALAELARIETNCEHCEHFQISRCALHGEVPVSFQKTPGQCADWRYDSIPF
jgi:hypothetical protein